ncbi:MAG TPA: DEAD/DEAH box helicase [Nitrospirales bacterium]|nr:DEAD/DEAH box helicase [Nitrospirales bacterium]HIN33614.1 DEAD/DEAH box helicase [Nitrospirales bacterium]
MPMSLPSHNDNATVASPALSIHMARKKTDNTPTKPRRSRPIDLSSFLEGIGPPEPTSFSLDPWQEEAIEKIQHGDVIVSVPTGSGKTYVAVEAARHAMAAEKTVLYTSPLKALSNTTFRICEKLGFIENDQSQGIESKVNFSAGRVVEQVS